MFRQCFERFSVGNMKKTGLYGYVYNFSVYYDSIDVDDILDIHNYLMKKKNDVWIYLKKCVSLNKQPCQARPTLVNVNCNQPHYFPFTVSVNKFGGSCNTINDSYAPVSVQDKV